MPSALPAVPFTGAALVLVTLPHHWRVGNLATLSIIAWLTALELVFGINAVIWAGNVDNAAPVWCDIATKIKIGAGMALPGCCLCMAKRLNRIAYGQEMSPRGWKHRALDIALCWGFPALVMVLHYVVQGHRFDIIENIGCLPAIYVSIPSLLILGVSAFLPSVIALLFCVLALTKLLRRRVALSTVVCKPNPSLTASRYVRLMVMTFVLGSWSAVLEAVSFSSDYDQGFSPYVSWDFVHADFGRIGRFTTARLSRDPANLRAIYILWFAASVSSLAFFLFFGIGVDAARDYRACGRWIARKVLGRECSRRPQLLDDSVLWEPSVDGDFEKSGSYAFNVHKQLPPLP